MSAVRAPQSKPATIALSISSASINAMASTARTDCCPLRNVFIREKPRRAVTAQVGDDHPVALRSQQRGHIEVAVNVVGPAVQENHCRAVGRPGVDVPDVQQAGIDLLQRAKRRARLGLARDRVCGAGHFAAPPRRSDRNDARISSEKSCGCSQAAKWPPRSSLL